MPVPAEPPALSPVGSQYVSSWCPSTMLYLSSEYKLKLAIDPLSIGVSTLEMGAFHLSTCAVRSKKVRGILRGRDGDVDHGLPIHRVVRWWSI